ncbi:MAG: alpha/beta hydrolase fold domain-containing protein, partial [Amylibacter sp.]|nr:alpha/beta hydrolase fold domain-containing protein [Amylibacter sp.]
GLPPVVAVSAECDPLCDDGEEYCAAIRKAGGQAVWVKEMGLIHGYLRARHTVDRARNSFSRVVAAVDAFGHKRPVCYAELMRIVD